LQCTKLQPNVNLSPILLYPICSTLLKKMYVQSCMSRPALGAYQPPIQWVPGVLSPGVKWPGCEADRSSPSTAEVKNVWSYTSSSPIHLNCVISLKKSTGTTLPLPSTFYSCKIGNIFFPIFEIALSGIPKHIKKSHFIEVNFSFSPSVS
jgi:hypothetical protein